MALGSLVWDMSATLIDVPLENAINIRFLIFTFIFDPSVDCTTMKPTEL